MRCPGLASERVLKGWFTHHGSLRLVLLGHFLGQRPDRSVWQALGAVTPGKLGGFGTSRVAEG